MTRKRSTGLTRTRHEGGVPPVSWTSEQFKHRRARHRSGTQAQASVAADVRVQRSAPLRFEVADEDGRQPFEVVARLGQD
jgi:hypothetical protein